MIYIAVANEDWVCNHLVDEWKYYNPGKFTDNFNECDKVWLVNDYIINTLPDLSEKTVITTIHHIDESKFNEKHFRKVENVTTHFHTICQKTFDLLKQKTNKKIILAPFPIDKNSYYEIINKNELRMKYNFKKDDFIIGSFQRDTEGDSIKSGNFSPKLSKGPDIFLEIIKKHYSQNKNLIVLLTGFRRNYLIKNFKDLGIRYRYLEKCSQEEVNELYNILDLYIVSSRTEGGPRSVFECGITKTNIVSTDVGITTDILAPESIFKNVEDFPNAKPNKEIAYFNVLKYLANTYMIDFNMKVFYA